MRERTSEENRASSSTPRSSLFPTSRSERRSPPDERGSRFRAPARPRALRRRGRPFCVSITTAPSSYRVCRLAMTARTRIVALRRPVVLAVLALRFVGGHGGGETEVSLGSAVTTLFAELFLLPLLCALVGGSWRSPRGECPFWFPPDGDRSRSRPGRLPFGDCHDDEPFPWRDATCGVPALRKRPPRRPATKAPPKKSAGSRRAKLSRSPAMSRSDRLLHVARHALDLFRRLVDVRANRIDHGFVTSGGGLTKGVRDASQAVGDLVLLIGDLRLRSLLGFAHDALGQTLEGLRDLDWRRPTGERERLVGGRRPEGGRRGARLVMASHRLLIRHGRPHSVESAGAPTRRRVWGQCNACARSDPLGSQSNELRAGRLGFAWRLPEKS